MARYIQWSFGVDPEDYNRVKMIAEREERTMAAQLRFIVKRWLEWREE